MKWIILFLFIATPCYAGANTETIWAELTVDGMVECQTVTTDTVKAQSVTSNIVSGGHVFANDLTIGGPTLTDPYWTFESDGGNGVLRWEDVGDYFEFDHRVDVLGNAILGKGAADTEISIGFDGVGTNSRLQWYATEQYFAMEEANVAADLVDFRAKGVTGVTVTGTSIYVDGGFLNVGSGAFTPFYQDAGDCYIDGELYSGEGFNAAARPYGVGLQIRESALAKTLVYADADFYASNGSLYVAGADFIADGVVTGDVVAITAGLYLGAVGEIEAVTSTTVLVSVAAAGGQALADASDLGMAIYNHPIVAILDNGDMHFHVGRSDDASFKVVSEESNSEHTVHIIAETPVTGHTALEIDFPTCVTGSTAAIGLNVCVEDYKDTWLGTGINVVVNNVGATGGDYHVIDVAVAEDNDDIEVDALATHRGVDVIKQYIGVEASLAYGEVYDDSAATYTDTTTEFDTAGNDIQIFAEDNDVIYVASANKFDEINVILVTNASHNVLVTFEYAEANAAAWIGFSPADDTNGFQQNGTIRFESGDLATWDVATETQVTGAGDAVDVYWIRITRTRNILPTSPTESTIHLTTVTQDNEWDKDGNVTCNTVTYVKSISFYETTTPNTPPANMATLFVDSGDNDFKIIWDDGSVETLETHP